MEYSNPKRESEPYSLPDLEVFQLTAEEVVQQDYDLMRQAAKQFPLMHMNPREREKALEWAINESGTTSGWFWCLPDSCACGPFSSYTEALQDARENNEYEEEQS